MLGKAPGSHRTAASPRGTTTSNPTIGCPSTHLEKIPATISLGAQPPAHSSHPTSERANRANRQARLVPVSRSNSGISPQRKIHSGGGRAPPSPTLGPWVARLAPSPPAFRLPRAPRFGCSCPWRAPSRAGCSPARCRPACSPLRRAATAVQPERATAAGDGGRPERSRQASRERRREGGGGGGTSPRGAWWDLPLRECGEPAAEPGFRTTVALLRRSSVK